MRREVHVRFCERLAVRLRGPTLPHMCARSRKGKFTVHVKTIGKTFHRGLKAIAEWCQKHRHEPVDAQQKTLNAKSAATTNTTDDRRTTTVSSSSIGASVGYGSKA
jgi:hypothetical protein